MNLRQRTLLSVAITLACLMAGAYLLSSQFLKRNYESLETRESTRNVQRVCDELAYQLKEMHSNASDWSNWDDTYKFIVDKNKAYIDSNLQSVLLDLDIMVFLDAQGKVFYCTPLPRKGHAAPPAAEDIRDALGFNRAPAFRPGAMQSYSGVLTLKNGDAVLITMRPIVKTSGAGPPRGWTVFGLRLDANEAKNLGDRNHLDIQLCDLPAAQKDAEIARAIQIANTGRPILIHPQNDHVISGYAVLSDVYGRPSKVVKVSDTRDIYAAGLASERRLLQFICVAGVIFSVVILWVLEVAALSRVSRLRQQVERIGEGEDDPTRISLPGKDELSWLARVIDGMIESQRVRKLELQNKHDDLAGTVRRLAATNHVLAHALEGIVEVDDQDRIIRFNVSFAEMHGYTEGRLEGFHWQTLIAPEDHEKVNEAILGMIECGKSQCEVRGRRQDGSLFDEEIVIVPAYDSEDCVIASHWFTKDISERKQLESKIKYQAFHDILTGLPNRALFVDRLRTSCRRAARRKEPIAVLFVDLDDFKSINDSMGHEAGDALLVGVAERIKDCIRDQDTVARLGGDEFVVLLENPKTSEGAIEVAERIVDSLRSPIALPTGKAFAGLSIGIAISKNGEEDAEALIRDADTAMYQAKDKSKPCFAVFDASMNAPAIERKELADSLRQALANDRLALEYHPIIELSTGRPTGIEALLRWRDFERGDVAPNLIAHVAEEAGLMDALGFWSLERACKQMNEWTAMLPSNSTITVNVNLSAKQLQHPELIKTVTKALEVSKLPAWRLCLEIPAKWVNSENDKAARILQNLQAIGVRLAVDDFGNGSHLISKLGEYPFDLVKIDGSITWALEEGEEAKALVQAVLIMANSVQVEVAAEGIETLAQLDILRNLGCTSGQGFIFCRPLLADQALEVLMRGASMCPFTRPVPERAA